jgi:hypothetical protein
VPERIFELLDGERVEEMVLNLTGDAPLFASGDRRVWQLSSDVRDLYREVIQGLGSRLVADYFCSRQEADDYVVELQAEPLSWPLATQKLDLLCSLARRIRKAGRRYTEQGGHLVGSKAAAASTISAAITQGTTTSVAKASAKEQRGAIASTVYLKLATNDVISAEALVEPCPLALEETRRIVAAYGQRGWATQFSNGLSKSTLAGAGLPANFVHSNTGLLAHARKLIQKAIGKGRDRGVMHGMVDQLAMLAVTGNWDDGMATHRDNKVWTYRPTVTLLIKVLGGRVATTEWATSEQAVGAGRVGDPTNNDSIDKAVRQLELIWIELYHKGGRSKLGGDGTFGLERFVESASQGLDVGRTIEILGRVLSAVHAEMDLLRTEIQGTCLGVYFSQQAGTSAATALPLGADSPFDPGAIIERVSKVGLPEFGAAQLSAENVKTELSQLGLTPNVLSSIAAWAASSPSKTRWGPALTFNADGSSLPPPRVHASLVSAASPAKRLHSPAPTPLVSPAPSRSASPAPITTDLGAVSALEKLSKREVCPWWSLFAKCRLSDADACTRCPSLQLATQAQVDEISARCDDNTKKRISGVPTDARGAPTANPAPGTGKEPSPKKKAKLDGV